MSDAHYPLMDNEADHLRAYSGRPLSEVTPEAITNGDLSAADLRIHADTLRAQAEIARGAGYEQLAANLLRAAELTVVPNEELLQMYDLLRPSRASWEQLAMLAERLEQTYAAHENARFVREAAEVYRTRGLLRR
jgi:propanediol dehydratase small subunit